MKIPRSFALLSALVAFGLFAPSSVIALEKCLSEASEVLTSSQDDATVETMGEIALQWDNRRSPEEVQRWKSYKNKPLATPRIFDLGSESATQTAEQFRAHRTIAKKFGPLMNYERSVILLKRGDTVVFGERRFKLGEFLGNGNATHVFALADLPGSVIRIPFVVRGLMASAADRMPKIRSYMRSYALRDSDFTATGVKKVTIAEVGKNYEYAITSRVDGTLSGDAFLNKIVSEMPSELGDRIKELEDKNLARLIANPQDKTRYRRLIDAAILIDRSHPGDWARQVVWSNSMRDWVLVDWE